MSDYKQTRSAAGDVTSQYGQMLRNLDDDLVKRLRRASIQPLPLNDYFKEAADRIDELEAKLAKAVDALESIAGKVPYADDPWGIAAAALLELQGETNDK